MKMMENENDATGRAIDLLNTLALYNAPIDMLQCIMECLRVASSAISTAGIEMIGADVLLPVFVYIVIHSSLRTPHQYVEYLLRFTQSHERLGEGGYSLATLEGAVLHIMGLTLTEVEAEGRPAGIELPENSIAMYKKAHSLIHSYMARRKRTRSVVTRMTVVNGQQHSETSLTMSHDQPSPMDEHDSFDMHAASLLQASTSTFENDIEKTGKTVSFSVEPPSPIPVLHHISDNETEGDDNDNGEYQSEFLKRSMSFSRMALEDGSVLSDVSPALTEEGDTGATPGRLRAYSRAKALEVIQRSGTRDPYTPQRISSSLNSSPYKPKTSKIDSKTLKHLNTMLSHVFSEDEVKKRQGTSQTVWS